VAGLSIDNLCARKYEFELRFKLPADAADPSQLVERLGEAGCDDALIGSGQPGRIALRFTREAKTAKTAIVSALRDVKRAIPDAKLIEAGPDFVGLSDVAELLGMSRQNLRKLMLAHPQTFPVPVHYGSTALWHLESVLLWLRGKGDYEISAELMDVAQVTLQINLIKAADRLDTPIQREVRSLVA
jgi:predicted DNA-binding transcriptional regulator AlpA